MSGLRFRDLGPLEIEENGAPSGRSAAPGSRPPWRCCSSTRITRSAPDALGEAMWGEQGLSRSAGTLDSHVWRLRRLLEPRPGAGGAPRRSGAANPVAIAWSSRRARIDSARFAALAAEAADTARGGRSPSGRCSAPRRPPRCGAGGRTVRPPTTRGPGAAVARLEEIRGGLRETHIGALLGLGARDRALAELEVALARGAAARAALGLPDDRLPRQRPPSRRPGHLHRGPHRSRRRARDRARAAAARPARRPAPRRHAAPSPRRQVDRSSGQRAHPHVSRDRAAGSSGATTSSPSCSTLLEHPAAGHAGGRRGLREDPAGRRGRATGRAAVPRRSLVRGPHLGDPRPRPRHRRLDSRAADRGSGRPGRGPAPVHGVAPDAARARQLRARARRCRRRARRRRSCVRGFGAHRCSPRAANPSRSTASTSSRLDPLPRPAAVELFLERLDGPAPAEAMSSRGRDRAAVDGLPLALELAAGRARAYTLAEIAAQVRADASTLSRVGRSRAGGAAAPTTAPSARRSTPATATFPPRSRRCTGPSERCPGPFTAGLAAGLVRRRRRHRRRRRVRAPFAADAARRRAPRRRVPLRAARHGPRTRQPRGRAGRRGSRRRARRLDRAAGPRPTRAGLDPHVGWYRALDDDLAALRATLQHTLVDAPSACGRGAGRQARRLLGVQRNGPGGRALAARRRPTVCRRPTRAGGPIARPSASIWAACRLVQGRADEGARPRPGGHRRGGRCHRRRRRAGVLRR